jgi:hypothetical protein
MVLIQQCALRGAALVAMCLCGCAHDYRSDTRFGDTVTHAIRAQTIDPAGVGTNGLKSGLDGQAAKATIDRYHKSFEQPQSLGNVYTIGVGSGGTAGGAMAK